MTAPIISIITPTIRDREHLLHTRCIPSVQAQDTTLPWEHIIVHDEPIEVSHHSGDFKWTSGTRHFYLGRNWRQFSRGASYGAMPRLAGTLLARGDYIAYLDDDDAFMRSHLRELVAFIVDQGADFVWSQFVRHWSDGRPDDVIGSDLSYGHIGTPIVLHRAECLLHANWGLQGYAEDFALFDAWAKAGLKHAHLPRVTVEVWKQV